MNIEIKNKEFLEKEIIITLSNDVIEIEKNKKISELLQSTTIKGFRKGHVTKEVLIKKFGENITNDSLKELINKVFIETINKNKFKIISLPIFQISKIKNNTIITINFEILPEINLNIEDIKIKEYISDITHSDVAAEIEKLKIIHGLWEETNLPINFGDIITLDLFNLEDNQEKQLLIDNDIFLYDEFIFFDGFVNSILNYKKDMNLIINLNDVKIFDKNLLNKKEIKIYIKKVMRSKKINDEIELKDKLEIKDDLTAKIKIKLEKNCSIISKKLLKSHIVEELLKKNVLEIPNCLFKDSLSDYEKRKVNISKEDIEKNIRLELLLNEIKIKFNITVSKDEVQKIFETFYPNVKNNKDIMYKKIENNILEEKVLNLIINKINITNEKIPYTYLKKLEIENVYKY